MLDVGCGWGSLSLHAAEHFGAQVTGVTIAAEQKKFIDARIAERGLEDRVEIRLQDYREVPERDHFDAVGSLEMGEHVGAANYPTYVEVLRRAVRPGGRVLVQQMSRQGAGGGKHPGGGPFIESFIAPDMTMRPVGETVDLIESGGLEVRDVHAMREHYVLTVAGWMERFEANLPRLRELVGEEVVRVWRLYLVGGALAFRDGRMGVDQILAVRPGAAHTLPARSARGERRPSSPLLAAAVVMGVDGGGQPAGGPGRGRRRRLGLGRSSRSPSCWRVVWPDAHSWLLALLVTVWGGRLAWHIARRSRGHGEDPRYEEMLGGPGWHAGAAQVLLRVFLTQAVVALGDLVPRRWSAAAYDVRWWPVVWVGVAVWAVGVFFEVVGDAQLAAYKRPSPRPRPPVLDTGLWGWTRHPNYFGDACVWWGLWIAGALSLGWLPGPATVFAPVAMTYFIRNVTGAKLLEKTMSQRDPAGTSTPPACRCSCRARRAAETADTGYPWRVRWACRPRSWGRKRTVPGDDPLDDAVERMLGGRRGGVPDRLPGRPAAAAALPDRPGRGGRCRGRGQRGVGAGLPRPRPVHRRRRRLPRLGHHDRPQPGPRPPAARQPPTRQRPGPRGPGRPPGRPSTSSSTRSAG